MDWVPVVGVSLEAVEHVLDGEEVDVELLLSVEPLLDELCVLLVEVVVGQLLVDGERLHVDVLLRQLVTALVQVRVVSLVGVDLIANGKCIYVV